MNNQKILTPIEGAATFPLRHRLFRVLWLVTWFVACSWTPPPLWRWRAMVLRAFGARIGRRCDVRGSVSVWYPPNLVMEDEAMLASGVRCYNVAPIILRAGALVSQRAYLCAASHDVSLPSFPLSPRPIVIGRQAWVAAEALVGPGVTVADGAVLGARGAAFADLDAWTIYRGNPATKLRARVRRPEPSSGA